MTTRNLQPSQMKTVLIIGSAPDAVRAREFDATRLSAIVAINNAWRIRDDWSHLIYPEDFADENKPAKGVGHAFVEFDQFVPANNAYGGIVYAGGTMAFTAAYWVLHALRPDIIAFIGCDMIYEPEANGTHFYGNGDADPLRDDPTLQSLEAKSNRLLWKAYQQNCVCLNLSLKVQSRLTFDRLDASALQHDLSAPYRMGMDKLARRIDGTTCETAETAEREFDVFVENGDYWNARIPLDASNLATIDQLWLNAVSSVAAD